ncbi:MAG: hypothetical protein HOP12_03305 [Candidatus Eisenbacteria bacterium]|uniref:Peptidase M12B domain-containing protein n=1 Tax=Eiseniibacteriota bacterium TaxID=2212470 RepID=A0A849SK16_UNCEI|nr:hypothetical protein [Candidatus Eisenbacteria bacterium]
MRRNLSHHLLSLGFGTLLAVPLLIGVLGREASGAPVFSRAAPASRTRLAADAESNGRDVTILNLDLAELTAFRGAGGGRLSLPTNAGEVRLVLKPFDVLGGGQVTLSGATGTRPAGANVSLFRGQVDGDADSWAVIAMSPTGVNGTFESNGRRRVLAPLGATVAGAAPQLVLADDTRDESLSAARWQCGVEGADAERALRDPARAGRDRLRLPGAEALATSSRLQLKIAVDCDFEMFAKLGGEPTAAARYMLVVLGTISLIYERDVNCNLIFPYLNFWTDSNDPYTASTTQAQLPQFRNYWNANRSGVSRSLAHLVSGRNLGGGIAYLDVLCGSFGYGVSAIDGNYTYPNNATTWDIEVIAHELGHNFGSPHTHSCDWQAGGFVPVGALLDTCNTAEGSCNSASPRVPPDKGTIMSYCHLLSAGISNIRLDFHPACKTVMRMAAEDATCETVVALQPPTELIGTPTSTGVQLSWTPGTTSGVTSYDVHRSRYQLDVASPKRGSTSSLGFTDEGFGTYFYRVRSIGAADSSQFSGELKVTACGLATASSFPTGGGPIAATRGDFNEDGIEDLATPNFVDGTVSVLLGEGVGGVGAGSFASPLTYFAGALPSCAVSGDWNGDGIADLAIGNNGSSNVSILFGKGSAGIGNGQFMSSSTVSGVSAPMDLAKGDFNEDGILDLVAVGGASTATLLFGNGASGVGNGTFSVGPTLTDLISPRAVQVADFDEDGIWDLAIAHDPGARVYRGAGTGGKGNGTFGPGTTYPCGVTPFSIAASDFDADGIVDLAIGNITSNNISILIGQGNGGIGTGAFVAGGSFPANDAPYGVKVADWSGDGIVDLVVANNTSARSVSILVGGGSASVGDGSFDAPTTFATTGPPRNTQVGDFDEDGATDVVSVNASSSSVNLLEASCLPTLTPSLALVQPDGGEVWLTGEEREIQWALGPGVVAVHLEVSRDGGVNWQRIAEHLIGTSFPWTVTEPFTSSARVRVVDAVFASRSDASDTTFTIVSPAAVAAPTPPRPRLALAGAWPNPARRQLTVAISLPDGAPATLELLDLAGRRLAGRSVGGLGAGTHQVSLLPERVLPQGVYLLRLARAGETRSCKVAFVQ